MKAFKRSIDIRRLCFGTLIGLLLGVNVHAAEDNNELEREILAATALHNPAFGFSLAAKPPASLWADGIVFAAGVLQKKLKAVLTVPEPVSEKPNMHLDGEPECGYEFVLPQSSFLFSDLFGFLKVSTIVNNSNLSWNDPKINIDFVNPLTGIPDDWGDLGTPFVFHQNAEVRLTANNPHIALTSDSQIVFLPAGVHTIKWRADTLIDPVFDIGVPLIMLGTSIYAHMKAPTFKAALDADAAKAVSELGTFKKTVYKTLQPEKFSKFKLKVLAWKTLEDKKTEYEIVSVSHQREQTFTVYDVHPPVIDVSTPNLTLEATDFGGVLFQRVGKQLRDDVTATDPCQRSASLSHNIPALIPLGSTRVTWTARDLGPKNAAGERNETQAFQTITVQDTQAPIMVPPPGRVLEVDPADTDNSDGKDRNGIDPSIVALGQPMVVDLADPRPTISSNAPNFFPVNTRTEVTWSATDHGFPSANTATGKQLITVKKKGTNTAPTVSNRTGSTLTSKPIDFVLTGTDNDMLGGRVDPLSFEIVKRPQHGEFVAPLFPFFIEDYRTDPGGPYGNSFIQEGNKNNWLYDNVCRKGDAIALDWVYKPRFVHVMDDGTQFMIDTYWKCNPSDASAGGPRISKWDADGNYIGQIDYRGTNDTFVVDQGGLLYTVNKQGAGSSTTLTLTQVRPDFDTNNDPIGDSWRFTFADTANDPVSNNQYSYARVDSRRGLIYVNDRRRIFVYDVREDLSNGIDEFKNGMDEQYLGALRNAEQIFACSSHGSSWSGFAMDVDSEGNLYVADTCGDRIHKFTTSYFNASGQFIMGNYVGWMGRCDSSTNKACDTDRQVSKGYSCTDATCTAVTTQGDQQGQFNTPVYLTVDPNDVLYVADTGNSRIQRFATDGTFAGEAVSTGTGINQGEYPSFVLGNMEPPKSVSVNSTQFFVVDTNESFVHVFQTTPFKEITDSSAKVTYISNFDFHNAQDSFSYRVSDGLAFSNTGTVNINVSRNYRPPEAFPDAVSTDEDIPVGIRLAGDDPDGILNVDFNGLDVLSYRIVTPPAHGVLTGANDNRSYRPDPDYYGKDSFTFVANDGRDDSRPATVTITINPVDDRPTVTQIDLPERIGAGFPILMNGTYRDDGAVTHNARVNWGNKVDVTGDLFDPDGEQGEQPPELVGAKVIEPPLRDGEGSVIAQNIYNSTGGRLVEYCMSDEQGRQHCMSEAINVERLVNLEVNMASSKEAISDDIAAVEVVVNNMLPEGITGLTANNVVIKSLPSDILRVTGFVVQPGGCTAPSGAALCNAGNMVPDGSIRIVAGVRRRAPVIFNTDEPVIFEVTTTSEAIRPVYQAVLNLRVLADPADSDGDGMTDVFENAYNLNPGSAGDASQDPDGDNLTNLDEFKDRTNPKKADSDGDGLRDNVEASLGTDPLSADSDGDGINDRRETDNGLDPLDFSDAGKDYDGDGLTNLEEVELGTNILAADTDGDGVNDGVDNCAVIANASQAGNPCKADNDKDGIAYESDNCPVSYNPDQRDTDLDGIGNACEPPVDLTGNVRSRDGDDVCAMVLASGKFMFSCHPNGLFSLTGLPLEADNTVKRQIYADGFFPRIDILADSIDDTVVMTRSGTCPSYNASYEPGFIPGSAGKRINITGRVLQQDSQTPICAMVLANGQHTFSCDGSGNYALNIPLDNNGQFKLQVYADGFAPTIQTFDDFKTTNIVRMARATECQ